MSTLSSLEEKGNGGPVVSELELESAILKGVSSHRPIGRHRHVLMIALQADVHRQTGIWVSTETLWEALAELYDLEVLDAMTSSPSSIPPSPDPLSPIPNPRRRRPRAPSDSPLSSPSPSPALPPSRSAQIINSRHFASVFELPIGRMPSMTPDTPVSPEAPADELDFASLLYARAKGSEEEGWDEAVRKQLDALEEAAPPPEPPKRRGGRKSRGGTASATASGPASRRTSGTGERGSSPLTSDGEPVLRGRKGAGAAARKRGRASTDTVEEEERPRGRGRRRL
ncbi:uncharacterized protein CcaverHIS019_0201510 [Cutaneotrichosporon cavernicola]|uniref:Chromatin modification-related protein EAF7 n=1 Tax=Cutaneotrichosporon cavernicola TaxID=279322 RepID=A0AA48KXY1_9TREE|nr:uncharacterized protein CcaverHIS019_0201510 [Cutaneotrichosporon cavernicola]BEI88789.1 hypothetical protein CcaverHIS019_0201510 [Cutaneotrichosporon cavernicola]BEI96564.1 hypothetical protein CcaverHIS631_0201530 [Cutaneotrichosporon cavernicola]BEJ04336.1 hypothetical protein CcaverHIS641_0201530 [Cutaneotrichosporon cavernicola]